jgi:hypothetical protein
MNLSNCRSVFLDFSGTSVTDSTTIDEQFINDLEKYAITDAPLMFNLQVGEKSIENIRSSVALKQIRETKSI